MFADEVNKQINFKNKASGYQRLIEIIFVIGLIGMLIYSIVKSCL